VKPLVLACLIDPFVQILRNRKMGATAGNRRRRNLPQPLQFRGPPLIPLPVTSCLFSRRRRPLIPTTGNNPHVPDANYMPHRPGCSGISAIIAYVACVPFMLCWSWIPGMVPA
jgi:hypothetical protein